tara:strand:- start:8394 stop:9251 length:858 start_codon:yes stop_codon:yes gene_type:complete
VAITSHGSTTKAEKGRFAFLPVILGAESVDNSSATAPTTITVKYRKHNSLSFTAKTLNGVTTTTSAAASASDTSVTLTDSSSFPPFGKAYVENELVEYTANNVSTATLTLSSGLSSTHSSGVTVTRIDWINLSSGIASAGSTEGYYLILFTSSELDTLGTFTYSVVFDTGTDEIVVRTIDVVAASGVDTESAPSVSACILKDHIVGLDGTPTENVSIYARLLSLPTLASSAGIIDQVVSAKTDANGFFQLSVPQGATLDVTIPAIGYRRTIVVPSATLQNLFEIA